MRRSTAIAAIIALFLVGILVGVLGTHAFYLHKLHQPGGLSALGTRLLAADLKHRLDLTAAQQAQVEKILAEGRAEAMAVRHEMLPRMHAILERSRQRISAILTPEQRAEFERYREQHHFRLHHLLSGG
ncbi:MAG TPA: hypothetical protein VOA87_06395 [Thermoanaerobaculia bacterium]|nr:hypothetical protein [Thermoanaerobaculia bacterium]